MNGTYTNSTSRIKAAGFTRTKLQRGASLLQILCVTAVFALLSAILFPRFATPSNMASAAASATAIESGSNMEAGNIMRQTRAKFDYAMHHGLFSPAIARTLRGE
jgi:hypothetical protein